MKDILKRLIRHTGFTISRYPSLAAFLRSRSVTLVLDIGANTGQFAHSLRVDGYSGEIISFEPVRQVYDTLVERMRGDNRWSGRNFALGATRTTGTINVSRNSLFSSVLPQSGFGATFEDGVKVVRTEKIEIYPLDEVMAEIKDHTSVFCKIDTQGFEESVLQGAKNALHKFCGLQLELPIEHLYEGAWSLSEALAKLDAMGFVPAQIRPASFITEDAVSWTELDCTFRRK